MKGTLPLVSGLLKVSNCKLLFVAAAVYICTQIDQFTCFVEVICYLPLGRNNPSVWTAVVDAMAVFEFTLENFAVPPAVDSIPMLHAFIVLTFIAVSIGASPDPIAFKISSIELAFIVIVVLLPDIFPSPLKFTVYIFAFICVFI